MNYSKILSPPHPPIQEVRLQDDLNVIQIEFKSYLVGLSGPRIQPNHSRDKTQQGYTFQLHVDGTYAVKLSAMLAPSRKIHLRFTYTFDSLGCGSALSRQR